MSLTIRSRVAGLALAGAAAITLTACGNTKTHDASAGPTLPSVQSEEEANASADASAEAAKATGPKTNERGNIVKALGEEGGITNPDGSAQLLTFAVDSITADAACTSEYAEPAENGHLVAVALRVSTSAALTADTYISVSPYDFKFIGADGITVDELGTMGAYSCMNDDDTFTSAQLGPAQMYVGTVVIDAPEAAGTLVFSPSWGQAGGWEYSF